MALQDLTMMPPSRLGCPLSLKTPDMGNTGYNRGAVEDQGDGGVSVRRQRPIDS